MTPTPPLPGDGDLPAVWTQLDFGLLDGDLYFPTSLAHDPESNLVYALGRCELEPQYVESGPTACLSKFDLEVDRVIAQMQIAASYTGKLVLAGETLYLNQPWNGALLALDPETLRVREVISDVLQVAFDGQASTYAATEEEVMRLAPDPVTQTAPFAQEESGNSLIDMAATADRVYVLSYEQLWILSSELAPVMTIDLGDIGPRDIAIAKSDCTSVPTKGFLPLTWRPSGSNK
jgi:hypothetical protein